jgi:ankyrin repeat protein
MKARLFALFGLVVTALAAGVAVAPAARADMNPFSDFYNNIARVAAQNDAAKIRDLLSQGYSPNQVDENNRTGLDVAASNGNLQIMAMLYKARADINQRDNVGSTALHYAAERDRLEAVKLLLDIGANVDVENKNGMTPLMYAAKVGDPDMVRALLAHGANPGKSDFTGRDAANFALDARHPAVAQLIRDAAARKR